MPSCLGGGDLDGDIYNLIPLSDPELADFEPETFPPASYPATKRKELDRPSTMDDVAEFVMDYLVSDVCGFFSARGVYLVDPWWPCSQVLGLVATSWLVIADQATPPTTHGIFDPACLTLANLHSDAVDYQKSGRPVDRQKIPKWKRKERPDWAAPETLDLNSKEGKMYYRSDLAIGRLARAVDLPAESDPMKGATRIDSQQNRGSQEAADWSIFADDDVYSVIAKYVEGFLPDIDQDAEDRFWSEGENLLARYTSDLQGICVTNTLSAARNASLSEEEAMVGTIVFKTPKPGRRKEMMARLRDSTRILVSGTRGVLEGGDEDDEEGFLVRAWYAWRVALDKGRQFGAQSFGWVALGATFEAIRRIEERNVAGRISMIAELARSSSNGY